MPLWQFMGNISSLSCVGFLLLSCSLYSRGVVDHSCMLYSKCAPTIYLNEVVIFGRLKSRQLVIPNVEFVPTAHHQCFQEAHRYAPNLFPGASSD